MNAESDLAAPFEKASLRRFVPSIIALLPAALSLWLLRTVTTGGAASDVSHFRERCAKDPYCRGDFAAWPRNAQTTDVTTDPA
jgi:hypothetical protein